MPKIVKVFLYLVISFILAFIITTFLGLFLPTPPTVEGKFTNLTEAIDKPNTLRYVLELPDGTLRYMEYKPCVTKNEQTDILNAGNDAYVASDDVIKYWQCRTKFKNDFRTESNKGMHTFINNYVVLNGDNSYILNGLTILPNSTIAWFVSFLTVVMFFILFRYWR